MEPLELLGDDACGENLGLGAARIETLPARTVYESMGIIPEELAQRYRCVPMHVEGNLLFLAMADPTDTLAIDDIRLITGYEVEPVPTDPQEIEAALRLPPHPHEDGPLNSPFPLQECRMAACLSGPLASVEVTHRFANLLPLPIEAVYIFPLPGGAAVHSFRMLVGDRVVEGVVQPQSRARQTYEEGQRQGHRVALLEQSRDNVVTAQLGNLAPGEQVTIQLSYVERVEQNSCENIFRFPLVKAPRYGDGGPAPRSSHGATLQLQVTLDDVYLSKLACSQHAIATRAENGQLRIELAQEQERLDRDFILRYSFQGDELASSLLVDEEHFLLTVMPPLGCAPRRVPRDVAFVLDRSGSMEGLKWVSAVEATLDFLATLSDGETFRIVAFDDRNEVFENGTVSAARRWLRRLEPRGGTDILGGLREAAASRSDCVILITDGQVTNEREVYREIDTWSARRLFTLGIDSAVNASFLREAARRGAGACELVTPGERLEAALARLARDTGSPLVTGLRLVDRGLNFLPDSLSPLPDLFPSRPISVSGRKLGHGPLEVAGTLASGEDWSVRVEPVRSTNPALGLLWARERIHRFEHDPNQAQAVEGLALRYRLLSSFTSFVLVDRAEVVNPGGETVLVLQPLAHPLHWREETVKDLSAQDFGPLEFGDEGGEDIQLDKLREMADEAPIQRVVNLILRQAIEDRASHIHLYPSAVELRVNYRIDGVLHDVMTPPKHIESPMFARLNGLAGLPLDARSGGGTFSFQSHQVQLRHANSRLILTLSDGQPVPLPPFLPALLERAGLVAVAGASTGFMRAVAQHLRGKNLHVLEAVGSELVQGWDLDAIVAERFCEAVLEGRTGVFGVPAPDLPSALAWLQARPELYARLSSVVAACYPRRKCCDAGCDKCGMTGYRGVVECFEWVEMQNPGHVQTLSGAEETTEAELARVFTGSGRRCPGTAGGRDQSSGSR